VKGDVAGLERVGEVLGLLSDPAALAAEIMRLEVESQRIKAATAAVVEETKALRAEYLRLRRRRYARPVRPS
jgi:regulator of replication initiation timing